MKKIVLKGIMRSGNTLLRLLLNETFNEYKCFPDYTFLNGEDRVLKSHTYENLTKLDPFLIIPWRDPRDVIASLMRVEYKDKRNFEYIKGAMKTHITGFVPNIHKMRNQVTQELSIKYEKFHDDFDYLFDLLENTFNGEISKDTREILKEKYSKESNKKIQNKYKGFGSYDEKTLIHGDHINTGYSTWETAIPEEFHGYLNYELEEVIKFWQTL